MKGFWENVVQPVCGGVMMIWFHPDKVNNPTPPHAYANGAFMLMQPDGLRGRRQARGRQGRRSTRTCTWPPASRQPGLRLRVVRNKGLYLVRMYTSLRQIIRGWSRIFYGTFGTFRRIAISLAVLMTGQHAALPLRGAGAGRCGALSGGAWWLACGLAGTATIAMQLAAIWRFSSLIDGRPGLAWTYPSAA